jgi:hypothetical protein
MIQWLKRCANRSRGLQQRDCPGFSPDSLFILLPTGEFGTVAETKVSDYSENKNLYRLRNGAEYILGNSVRRPSNPINPDSWKGAVAFMGRIIDLYNNQIK